MFIDDIEALVAQTFQMVHDPHLDRGFNIDNQDEIPASSGLWYRLEKKHDFFQIKAQETSCLRDVHPLERKGNHYFATEYLEQAQMLKQEYSHYRFPLFEERIYNLGDPSLSWWMVHTHNSLKITFKNGGEILDSDLKLKLGFLGDIPLFIFKMNRAQAFLTKALAIQQFQVNHKEFILRCGTDVSLDLFNIFKQIFIEGCDPAVFFEKTCFKLAEDRTTYFFFKELAVLRRFWLDIQKKIQSLE